MCPLPFDIHVTLQNFESLLFKLPDISGIGINGESIISTKFASNRSPDVAVSDLPPQQVGGWYLAQCLNRTPPSLSLDQKVIVIAVVPFNDV
jgi:hypothetical protein